MQRTLIALMVAVSLTVIPGVRVAWSTDAPFMDVVETGASGLTFQLTLTAHTQIGPNPPYSYSPPLGAGEYPGRSSISALFVLDPTLTWGSGGPSYTPSGYTPYNGVPSGTSSNTPDTWFSRILVIQYNSAGPSVGLVDAYNVDGSGAATGTPVLKVPATLSSTNLYPYVVNQNHNVYGYLFWDTSHPSTGTNPSTNAVIADQRVGVPGAAGIFSIPGEAPGSSLPYGVVGQWIDPNNPYVDPSANPVPPGWAIVNEGLTVVSQSPPASVPLPSALLLLGPGLIGLVAARRKLKN